MRGVVARGTGAGAGWETGGGGIRGVVARETR